MARTPRTDHVDADSDPWHADREWAERAPGGRSPGALYRSDGGSLTGRTRRSHGWQWALAALVVLLTAAGGAYLGQSWTGSSKPVHPSTGPFPGTQPNLAPDEPGYLATGSDFVDFMWWKDHAGVLSGSASEVVTQGAAPSLATTSYSFAVSGNLRGSGIILSYDHGNHVFGSVSGDSFSVDFPKPDGSLAPVEFDRATTQEYSSALDDLGQRVDQANQTAESGLVLQQEEQAIKHDEEIVSDDIALVSQDEAAASSYITEIPTTLQDEAKALATTLAIEQQAAAQGGGDGQSQSCSDATRVASSVEQVAGDDSEVEGDAGGVEASLSPVNGLRGDIAELRKDLSQLQEDEVILPGYVPAGSPDQTEVTSALAGADSTVQWALSTTNGYIDQANGDLTTAFSYVDQTYRAGNCGSPEPTPPPAQHIS